MPVKLLTSGGGGVNLVPSSSIASDQTMYLPTSGTSGGTVLCTDSSGGTANGVLYLNGSKQVTSGSGLVFDSSGNLLVGTTNSNPVGTRTYGVCIGRPGYGIDIRQLSNTSDWGISESSGSIVNLYSDNGSTFVHAGTISVNGSTAAYTSISDYRLKENVQPMIGALDSVMSLNPVTFTFKNSGQLSQGFIAHELQAVVPDCVTGEKDAVDVDGKPVYQGIDTSFLVATLTAAIQEQQAIIESLTQRIEALEYTK